MIFLHIQNPSDPLSVKEKKPEGSKEKIKKAIQFIKEGKHVFVLIYARGCGPCQQTRPGWHKIKNLPERKDVVVICVDKDYLDLKESQELSKLVKKSTIVGYPTLRYVKLKQGSDHVDVEDFEKSSVSQKSRTSDSFDAWIKLKAKEKTLMKGGTMKKKTMKRKTMKRKTIKSKIIKSKTMKRKRH